MNADRPIGIAGAGAIGCFVGGMLASGGRRGGAPGTGGAGGIGCFGGAMLASGGRRVALLARPRVIAEIEAHGLRLTSFDGFDQTVTRDRFALSENPHLFEKT